MRKKNKSITRIVASEAIFNEISEARGFVHFVVSDDVDDAVRAAPRAFVNRTVRAAAYGDVNIAVRAAVHNAVDIAVDSPAYDAVITALHNVVE